MPSDFVFIRELLFNMKMMSMIFGCVWFFTPSIINSKCWAQILMGLFADDSQDLALIGDDIVLNTCLCLYFLLISMQMHLHTMLEDPSRVFKISLKLVRAPELNFALEI